MTFREAVESTASITGSFAQGLQALAAADRERMSISNSRRLRGSVDVDGALRNLRPGEHRWDFSIGLETARRVERALWIEVHSANSLHIDTVINKRRWLRQWLDSEAATLKAITPSLNYVWLASGAVAFAKG
jgi:hypothetical protein